MFRGVVFPDTVYTAMCYYFLRTTIPAGNVSVLV